jgi:hypothetical protein
MNGRRLISSLVVTGALLVPGLSQVAAAQTRANVRVGPVTVRVYDRAHKDYHVWDSQEDRRYREYLNSNHQTYRPIYRLSRQRQITYWNSRHSDR